MSSVSNPSLLSVIKGFYPGTAICAFKNVRHIYYKQSGTRDLFPLRVFYNLDSIANIFHLLMLPVSSELSLIPTTNLICSSVLAQIPSSSFTIYSWDYTTLILMPLMYLTLPLTLSLFFVLSNRTRLFFIYPKSKEQMLPEFYNMLLDSLPAQNLKA